MTSVRAEVLCEVTTPNLSCQTCGTQVTPRDTFIRRIAHSPFSFRSTSLAIRHRRYRCTQCHDVWREDLTRAVPPRQKLSHTALRWALYGLVNQHLSFSRIAEGVGVSWNTAYGAVLAEGQRLLLNAPTAKYGLMVLAVWLSGFPVPSRQVAGLAVPTSAIQHPDTL